MKDNFSGNSNLYAIYRPSYPQELFDFIFSKLNHFDSAWDVGTGNGQVAKVLANRFQLVEASDISQDQLDNAFNADNIHYSCQTAEKTNFTEHSFDLIAIAQAIHWFDFEKFYKEVRRTAKPGALIAVIGYGQHLVTPEIDQFLEVFYNTTLGPFWDDERHYIDERYATIPFPFAEMVVPEFTMSLHWTFDQYIGYLSTWSALKHYKKANNYDPLDALSAQIKPLWPKEKSLKVQFPVLFRLGEVQ